MQRPAEHFTNQSDFQGKHEFAALYAQRSSNQTKSRELCLNLVIAMVEASRQHWMCRNCRGDWKTPWPLASDVRRQQRDAGLEPRLQDICGRPARRGKQVRLSDAQNTGPRGSFVLCYFCDSHTGMILRMLLGSVDQ